LLALYSRLLAGTTDLTIGRFPGALILIVAISVPLLLALGFYNPSIAIVTLISIASLIALILFFDVRAFATSIFPLVFLTTDDRYMIAMLVIIGVGLFIGLISRAKLELSMGHPILISLILLTGYLAISGAREVSTAKYLFLAVTLIPTLMFLAFYQLRLRPAEMRRLLVILSCVIALIGYVSLMRYLQTGLGRDVFLWPSQNAAACFFGLVLPFTVTATMEAKTLASRTAFAILLLGALAAIFITQTRAILVSSVIGLAYLAASNRKILKVMLPVFIVSSVALPGLIISRLAMLFGHGVIPDWSSVGRIQVWMNSLLMLPDYFFRGMGLASYPEIYAARFPDSFIQPLHPHNILLHWIFNFGLIGMAALASFIGILLFKGIKAIRNTVEAGRSAEKSLLLALNAGILTALIANMLDATLGNPMVAPLFWVLLSLQLTLTERLMENPSEAAKAKLAVGSPRAA